MKKITAICAPILLLIACTNNTGINTDNIAIVEKYIQAVQSKDINAMTALLADDYVGYGPSYSDSINKKDAIANWKNVSENLYESIEYTRSFHFAAKLTEGARPGDYVADWSSLKIKYKDGVGLFI